MRVECLPPFPSEPRVVDCGANNDEKNGSLKKNLQATNIAISALVIERMLISMIPNTNCTTQPI